MQQHSGYDKIYSQGRGNFTGQTVPSKQPIRQRTTGRLMSGWRGHCESGFEGLVGAFSFGAALQVDPDAVVEIQISDDSRVAHFDFQRCAGGGVHNPIPSKTCDEGASSVLSLPAAKAYTCSFGM